MAEATNSSSSVAPAPVQQHTILGMTPDELSEAIFGTFDGMTSLLGVIAGALVSGTEHILVVTAAGLAVAATVSMAGGEFLSDSGTAGARRRRAAIMGLATFIGSFLPVIPYLLFARTPATVASVAVTLLMAVGIAQARVPKQGAVAAYVQTFAILIIAGALSIITTVALGATG
jgi:VIT1/CCC1 family predicted Fe2+/Mn2+ transporter